jgi:hypothetical protein
MYDGYRRFFSEGKVARGERLSIQLNIVQG